MSDVLIVGSLALDSVTTPFGDREESWGGAALYSAAAASLLSPVHLVGVIGEDFPAAALEVLAARGVSLDGVQSVPGGKSFRWAGEYTYAMDAATTLDTQLNVFADFNPHVPTSARGAEFVFLANITPVLQLQVLDQMTSPRLVLCDTMNYWIENAREDLLRVLARVDGAAMNDAEVRQLTGTPNLCRAAAEILSLGPRFLLLKKGEYGASLITRQGHFALPSYPLPNVLDPTGAGDSFAGGFIGFLAWVGSTEEATLRQALAIGTVTASACVEAFSWDALLQLTDQDLYSRYEELREMVRLEPCPLANSG
ncbi:MAG: sugar kinase [candidate division WS1 bacterium]|nr:sugar kinase [candidate division WS1 bacterium]